MAAVQKLSMTFLFYNFLLRSTVNSGTAEPETFPVVPLFQKTTKLKVIILKNAEQNPEFAEVFRRE